MPTEPLNGPTVAENDVSNVVKALPRCLRCKRARSFIGTPTFACPFACSTLVWS